MYFDCFRSRNFRIYWIGQTVSRLGDAMFGLGLSWLVLDLTRSATVLGVVMAVMGVPMLLFALVGGALGDQFNRRKVMIWLDCSAALLNLLLWALVTTGAIRIWHLYVMGFLFGSVEAWFIPQYMAILPGLLTDAQLESANAAIGFSEQAGSIVGPALGGLVVALLGSSGAFAVNAATFLVSALCLARIPDVPALTGPNAGTLVETIRQGLEYLLKTPVLLSLLVLYAVANFGLEPLFVLLPVWAREVARSPAVLGFLGTTISAGMVLGVLLVPVIRRRLNPGRIVLTFWIIEGGLLILFSRGHTVPYAASVLLVLGIFLAVEMAMVNTIYQRLAARALLGTLTGIRVVLIYLLRPLAQALSGFAGDRIGIPVTMVLGGATMLLAGFSGLASHSLKNG